MLQEIYVEEGIEGFYANKDESAGKQKTQGRRDT